jgi:hypothetical protein
MSRLRLPLALSAVLCALVLVACSASVEPTSTASPSNQVTPSPSETVTPSPAETQEPVTAAQLTLSATSFSVVNSDGSDGATFSFFDPVDPVVDALTTAFGFEPVLTDVPEPYECSPYRIFQWGEFQLLDESAAAEAIGPLMFRFSVSTNEPQTGDVIVETTNGVAVGDAVTDIAQLYPAVSPQLLEDGQEYYTFETDVVFDSDADGTQIPYSAKATGMSNEAIRTIYAPVGGPGRC